ncbi:MAG: riboflavin synthase [candidate division WOR-3 bacterium]
MFTGLVSAVGRVERVATRAGNRLFTIATSGEWQAAKGESIAVNGCCLTVVAVEEGGFRVEAVETTLKGTTLGRLKVGSRVNLERALAVGERLGGHLVQGHVDEVGEVRMIERRPGLTVLTIGVKPESMKFVVPKGSVCVDGVSLTVAGVRGREFSVNIIPYTWERTTFRHLKRGDRVNIEFDLVVKAVRHHLDSRAAL